MPTAAKLICAILMAGVGYYTSVIIVAEVLPDGIQIGWFREVNAVFGLIIGWRYLGSAVGNTPGASLAAGLTAAAMLLFLGLFVQAFYEMILRSLDIKYDAPGKAVDDFLKIFWAYAQQSWNVTVYGTLFGGGAISGLLGHGAARLWR